MIDRHKFQYISSYQNLHLDRANKNSMITINIGFFHDVANDGQPKLLYRYEHGLNYIPIFWGFWQVTWPGNVQNRGYGSLSRTGGAGVQADLYYTIDNKYVYLYVRKSSLFGGATGSLALNGTRVTFTGYAFSNDRSTKEFKIGE